MLEALAAARAIVIGPSNPVISIGPILALPGMREALRAAPAPVVAVSPIVGGAVLKGPTAAFLAHAGLPVSAAGIARAYAGVIDGLLADEGDGVDDVRVAIADTLMDDAEGRRRVAPGGARSRRRRPAGMMRACRSSSSSPSSGSIWPSAASATAGCGRPTASRSRRGCSPTSWRR